MRAELARAGYVPRQLPRVDLTGVAGLDPLDAWGRCGGRSVLVDVEMVRCRILDLVGFACAPGDPNPFVETARGILEGTTTRYEGSALQRYYESFTPRRILDLYGWPEQACSPVLLERSTHAVTPWQKAPGEHMAAVRRKVSAHDHAPFGDLPPGDESWLDWGPVSPAKAAIEFRRIAEVAVSIRANGYVPGDDHMTAHLLVDGARSAVWIICGHHRIAALAALGYRVVPMTVLREVYRRDEVDTWPGVVSGAFTRAQALEAFDMVFRGRRPPDPGCDWLLDPPERRRGSGRAAAAGAARRAASE